MENRSIRKPRKIIAWALALAVAAGVAAGSALSAQADVWTPSPTEKVADWATAHEFPGHGAAEGYFSVSRNPGRIWTDKTVYADSTPYQEDEVAGENELIVSLSGLGSTRHITSSSKIPVDLVMVLDNSYSMTQCVKSSDSSDGYCDDKANYEKSRAWTMADAVNEAMRIIAGNNSQNRVAVVRFGTDAGELVGLVPPAKLKDSDRYANLTYSGNDKNGTMTFAVGTKTMTIGKNGTTTQSTNTQAGIFAGMNILATATNVTGENQRVPNVLIFTDGEATLSSSSTSWWNPGSGTQGPSTPCSATASSCTQYYGNGFKAAMTAAFLKAKITATYNDETFNGENGTTIEPKVYTVGLGLDALHPVARDLGRATLDPSSQLGLSNTSAAGFTSAWNSYADGNSPTVPVAAGTSAFKMSHPTGDAQKYDPTSLAYNDEFYEPMSTEDMRSVFESIARSIVDAPHFPVKSSEGTPGTGYITYTDPLGQFMEVTNVTRLYFCSLPEDSANADDCDAPVFSNVVKTSDTASNTDKYTFIGSYKANSLSEPADLSKIVITVRKSASLAAGDVVTVQIPMTLLPLRDSSVTIGADGQPTKMTQHAAHPFHLDYTVAPKAAALEYLSDPMALSQESSADATALSEYLTSHTTNGEVRFYAGDFIGGDSPEAKATASFVPDIANEFYRFSEDTPLFADAGLATALTWEAWTELAGDGLVYYPTDEYYYTQDGVARFDRAANTTKDELLAVQDATHKVSDVGGVATVAAGTMGVNFPHTLDHAKCENLTWADDSPVCAQPSNPSGTDAMALSSRLTGELVVETLGNNGYLAYQVPGTLTISKLVAATTGLNPAADTEFAFQVALADAEGQPLSGSFAYAVFSESDLTSPVRVGTLSYGGLLPDADTITITAGQQANIIGLPDGTQYTVTEINLPAGYQQSVPNGPATGQLDVETTQGVAIEFENTYTPAAAQVDAAPTAAKVFTGRDWRESDQFEVRLCGPVETTPNTCETAVFTQADHGAQTFHGRSFAAPGTYTYTLTEAWGSAIGVSYSGAEYQWVVSVTDNGSGQLHAAQQLYQVRDDDGQPLAESQQAALATFTNTFSLDSIQGNLDLTKMIKDSTLGGDQLRAPALEHEFAFEYLGAIPPYHQLAPLFTDEQVSATAKNAAGSSSVVSPAITFQASHVNHAFYYKAWEVVDPGKKDFVTYDDSVWFFKLDVSEAIDEDGPAIQVLSTHCQTTQAAIAAMPEADGFGECTPEEGVYTDAEPVFTNTYTPANGQIVIQGTKELSGREWLPGDSFTFRLVPNDAATAVAISNGAIWFAGSDEVTVGYYDQVAEKADFAFTLYSNKQGNYQFALREVVPAEAEPGIVYDHSTAIFDVVVDDLNVDGLLFPDVYLRGDNLQEPVGKAAFTNRYQATTRFAGVDVVKTLTGRAPVAGEFAFTVTPVETSTVTAKEAQAKARFADSDTPDEPGTMTVTNGEGYANPRMTRLPGDFEFTQADLGKEFGYLVTEDDTQVGGVVYDQTAYLLTLIPVYDQDSGKLYIKSVIDNLALENDGLDEPAVHDSRDGSVPTIGFSNSYSAAATTVTPSFTKEISGRDWKDDEVFEFQLVPADSGTRNAIAAGDAYLPQGADELTALVGNDTGSRKVAFDFGEFSFSAAGTYRFAVTEITPQTPAGGLDYDPDTAEFAVHVADDGTGQLSAEIEYDSNRAFLNNYTARHHWHVVVGKTLEGMDMEEGMFTFKAVPVDAASAQAADIEMDGVEFTNSAAEAGEEALMPRMSGLHLTQESAGTYCYYYFEEEPSQPGITHDDTVYLLCVTVTDDGNGHLVVDATVDSVNDEEGEDGVHERYEQSSADEELVFPVLHFRNTCDPLAVNSVCAAKPAPGPQPVPVAPVDDPSNDPAPPAEGPVNDPVPGPVDGPVFDPGDTPAEEPAEDPAGDPATGPEADPTEPAADPSPAAPADEPADQPSGDSSGDPSGDTSGDTSGDPDTIPAAPDYTPAVCPEGEVFEKLEEDGTATCATPAPVEDPDTSLKGDLDKQDSEQTGETEPEESEAAVVEEAAQEPAGSTGGGASVRTGGQVVGWGAAWIGLAGLAGAGLLLAAVWLLRRRRPESGR
ncbi:MAG: DUF5979 domain-containing protein [Propionibacteriaceae bacterium]|jgi:pilin isopeptide linkage protein|nr:DUF5979 domain-containing protein [Propionibacteriaceae bacterium]